MQLDQRLQLGRLLDLYPCLVDPEVGIVRRVAPLPVAEDDPNFFHFLSTSCNTQAFTTLKNFGNNGGVSDNRYVAIAKAIGEAIERYSSAIFSYEDLIYSAYENLDEPATDPSQYALYTEEQHARGDLPWKRFTPQSVLSWTRGKKLGGGTMLLPAAMVYVPYHYQKKRGDAAIVQPISTGLAAGCSYSEAVLSGLCEVIERDAFTLTWQAMLRRPRVRQATLPDSCVNLIDRYRAVGIKVAIVNITSDIRVPTLLTIALSDSKSSPAIAVAAATDLSAERALIKSLEELAHTRKFSKQLMEFTPEIQNQMESGHPLVRDQRDHLRFYCPQRAKEWIAFLTASDAEIGLTEVGDLPAGDASEAVELIVHEMGNAGLDAFAVDLTTSDIQPLGLSVVRVVAPGMNPLFMGYSNRALGGARFRRVAVSRESGIPSGKKDNPYPHPFP